MKIILRIFIVLIMIGMMSCNSSNDSSVPRRTAYPRIYPYDSAYVEIDSIPATIMVNRDAVHNVEYKGDGSVWLNIGYPKYKATIYCTLTPVDVSNVETVIDNRAERIHRNIGSAQANIVENENAYGYYSNMVVTPAVLTTPVQFLAVDNSEPEWVLSGTVFFEDAASISSTDSVRPMIDVMQRDVETMLRYIGK